MAPLIHTSAVFLHLVGVAGMFASLGLELGALRSLAAAADDAAADAAPAVRRATSSFHVGRVLGPVSLLLILGPGLWLAAQIGEASASWAGPSIGGLVVVIVLGAAVTGRGITKIEREGAAAVAASIGSLRASFAARTAILVVILFLMVAKP